MAPEIPDQPFIDPVVLAKWILEKVEIWQERKPFMKPDEFARFCTDRGIPLLWDQTVIRLWQLGLLRADLVHSTRRIRKVGLVEIGKTSKGKYAYADARATREFPKGLGAVASRLRSLNPSTTLFFHPFRFCVLCQYEELSRLIPPMTALTSVNGFHQLQKHFEDFQERCGSERYLRAFLTANNIASLAIATEPCIYPRIFHRLRFRTDEATHRKHVDEHWIQIEKTYKEIGEEPIGKAWERLNKYSSDLEQNRELHEKLRLARNEVREEKLKGPLAGAIFLKTIAEVIRRAAENVFDTKWHEEGETWGGGDYKERRYGSRRIFDGNGRVSDRVLREWWPNFGLHVRWYVEGDTELGALEYHFGEAPSGIDLVMFGGTAPGFLRQQLRNDLKNEIYSLVSFDRSVQDKTNYKWFQNRLKDGEFFGVWYVSEPDFEFANFSLDELQDALWEMAVENGAAPGSRAVLLENTKHCRNSKELERAARRLPELAGFKKDKQWGSRLMIYAENHPQKREGGERPIFAALRDGFRGAEGWFYHHIDRSMFKVDPVTGTFVPKVSC